MKLNPWLSLTKLQIFSVLSTILQRFLTKSGAKTNLQLDDSQSVLWLCQSFSLIMQNQSFDYAELILWFYWNIEPSTLSRRAFVIATAKARHFDGEPSATSWIQRSGSVYPHMHFRLFPKAVRWIPKSAISNACTSISASCGTTSPRRKQWLLSATYCSWSTQRYPLA